TTLSVPEENGGSSATNMLDKKRTSTTNTHPDGGKKARVGDTPADALTSPPPSQLTPTPTETAPNSGAVHEEQKGSSTVPTGETLDLVDYDEEKESFITPPE
ncbi:hypothetical protein BGZ92_005652, partial [Podila epicladia]